MKVYYISILLFIFEIFSNRFFRFNTAEAKQREDYKGKFAFICSNTPAGYGILPSRTSSLPESLKRGSYRKENPFHHPLTNVREAWVIGKRTELRDQFLGMEEKSKLNLA